MAFALFSELYPNLVEGFTNAGVALEGLGRNEEAKKKYRDVLARFPGHEKAINPLLNVNSAQIARAQILSSAFRDTSEVPCSSRRRPLPT